VSTQALAHGYYVVKNPGQTQLDKAIMFDEARKASNSRCVTVWLFCCREASYTLRARTYSL
jgi:hypothetical protein